LLQYVNKNRLTDSQEGYVFTRVFATVYTDRPIIRAVSYYVAT